MAKIHFKEIEVNTNGELPSVGVTAPEFVLVKNDLTEQRLSDLKGKRVVLNIFPSVDTGVCATSVRRFNKEASTKENTVVLCISKDLPFAQGRFCGAEGIDNVVMLSDYRNAEFAKNYGVLQIDGPLNGLMARAVVVIDEEGKVAYTEMVGNIVEEPNYTAAMEAIK